MAPFGKIHSYPGNLRVQRAQVVAALNGLEVPLAEGFAMGQTNRTPEFLAKFPLGKVPALECADGFCIAEGAAICDYLASSGPAATQLLGAADDTKTRARIAEWSCFAENELVPNVMPAAVMCVYKVVPYDEKKYDMSAANLVRALKRLEVAVRDGRKFLVGEQVSLADVMVAGPLFFGLGFLIDAEMKKDVPETVRYLQGLAGIPEFKSVFGELKLVETRVKP
ncbi:Elongation factor 1-gamma 1 [Seiridium cupressi]